MPSRVRLPAWQLYFNHAMKMATISSNGDGRHCYERRKMKKKRNINLSASLLLLFAIGFSACTNSEVVDPEQGQQKPICFSGNLQDGEVVSRADRGLEEVLDSKAFKVWSYKNTAVSGANYTGSQAVMPGYTVMWGNGTANTTTSNTNDWEYVGIDNQYIKYWDYSASAYRFMAYAQGNASDVPAVDPSEVTVDTSDDTKISFTAAVDATTDAKADAAPYFSELWFSNDKEATYGKPVTLSFLKPFARVRFMFTFVDGLDFGREALHKIRFYPIPDSDAGSPKIPAVGNVTITYPLTGTGTKETWSVEPTGGIDAFTIDWNPTPDPSEIPEDVPADGEPTTWPNTAEKWYNVLPTEKQGSYILEVAVSSPDIKTATVPASYMTWKAGHEYTYVFKINERGGVTIDVIQVAVKGWVQVMPPVDHPVFNW